MATISLPCIACLGTTTSPSKLPHIDIKKLPRVDKVDHRITGDLWQRARNMGVDYVVTRSGDCVSRIDLSDARTVMAQLPAAFRRFNQVHLTCPAF